VLDSIGVAYFYIFALDNFNISNLSYVNPKAITYFWSVSVFVDSYSWYRRDLIGGLSCRHNPVQSLRVDEPTELDNARKISMSKCFGQIGIVNRSPSGALKASVRSTSDHTQTTH
jgi:hypothetical protein